MLPDEAEYPMGQRSAFGRELGERFGLRDAPVLVTKTLRQTELAVTQLKGDTWLPVRSTSIPAEDAYLIGLQVRGCDDHELWFDGKALGRAPFKAGSSLFYDLRRDPIAEMRSPFHGLMFYLPRRALDTFTEEMNAPRINELKCLPGAVFDDSTIRNLGFSLLTAFDYPDRASRLFVDHITTGIGIHVVASYGGITCREPRAKGGLAAWQERRVKEVMDARLNGDVSVKALAAECELSIAHFSRAFRASTGMAPHQWLMLRRIEATKSLMRRRDLALSEIAVACGFADQSHFTRAFSKATGISPGAWRRDVAAPN
jgi:AraC-like DNA-binding protein